MVQYKKTKYMLELDAKEFAAFVAAISLLNKNKLKEHFGVHLDEDIYNILASSKENILQTLYKNSNESCFVPSDIIKNVLKGEELT